MCQIGTGWIDNCEIVQICDFWPHRAIVFTDHGDIWCCTLLMSNLAVISWDPAVLSRNLGKTRKMVEDLSQSNKTGKFYISWVKCVWEKVTENFDGHPDVGGRRLKSTPCWYHFNKVDASWSSCHEECVEIFYLWWLYSLRWCCDIDSIFVYTLLIDWLIDWLIIKLNTFCNCRTKFIVI